MAEGYVYVHRIGDLNLFKVGRSVDVERRARDHATSNHEPLALVHTIESVDASQCEKFLKDRLRLQQSRQSPAREFYEIDDEQLAGEVARAREYERVVLARRPEVDRLAEAETDERMLPAEPYREAFQRLQEAHHAADCAKQELERAEIELKLAIGTASGIEGLVSWKTGVRHRLDSAALKEAEPAIYERFAHEQRCRMFRIL